jgi:hypothetical protein
MGISPPTLRRFDQEFCPEFRDSQGTAGQQWIFTDWKSDDFRWNVSARAFVIEALDLAMALSMRFQRFEISRASEI